MARSRPQSKPVIYPGTGDTSSRPLSRQNKSAVSHICFLYLVCYFPPVILETFSKLQSIFIEGCVFSRQKKSASCPLGGQRSWESLGVPKEGEMGRLAILGCGNTDPIPGAFSKKQGLMYITGETRAPKLHETRYQFPVCTTWFFFF